MKTKTTITIAFCSCLAFGQEFLQDYSDSAFPLLAAVCDIAGIGELVSQTSTNAVININQCWYSAIPTNSITVRLYGNEAIPAGGTNFLFFASQYSVDYGPYGLAAYPNIFRMDEIRQNFKPNTSMYLMGGDRSQIPVVAENADLISWSSNLVYTSQISPDMQAFYELIRDGYRFNHDTSRIYRDSMNAFFLAEWYMSTNFMQQTWADTNLIHWARTSINNAYMRKTNNTLGVSYARKDDSALPLLAAVCDTIGIGELESKTNTNVLINVSQLWLGDPQQKRLNVRIDGESLPEAGTPFLFFYPNIHKSASLNHGSSVLGLCSTLRLAASFSLATCIFLAAAAQ